MLAAVSRVVSASRVPASRTEQLSAGPPHRDVEESPDSLCGWWKAPSRSPDPSDTRLSERFALVAQEGRAGAPGQQSVSKRLSFRQDKSSCHEQPHPNQALGEPRIGAQTIPLRRNG
jgi:hypothetical protein